jgi:predicted house-cleaning NTP pyrophosphatase (Maf/HAM1 superfamily)
MPLNEFNIVVQPAPKENVMQGYMASIAEDQLDCWGCTYADALGRILLELIDGNTKYGQPMPLIQSVTLWDDQRKPIPLETGINQIYDRHQL